MADRQADLLAVLEVGCYAMLAEIARLRKANEPDSPRRRRGPSPRVVPLSETCSQAARDALVDLQRAGLIVRKQ